jgi:hypothetical protein
MFKIVQQTCPRNVVDIHQCLSQKPVTVRVTTMPLLPSQERVDRTWQPQYAEALATQAKWKDENNIIKLL